MDRRDFVKWSGALGLLSVVPFSCHAVEDPSSFKMGYQLYSIRDEMGKDPIATLKALQAMGYQDFEHYGFDPDKGTYYGIKTAEFKSILDDLGLTITSGHYPFADLLDRSDDDLFQFTDQCIEGALIMESPYITWPWLNPERHTIEGFKLVASKLNKIGERVTQAGLDFAYHNHGFEFVEMDGISGYEIITQETDPALVKLQLDMYWVMHAGKQTPREIIEEHPGRVVMWHIKDMHKVSRDYTELGNGSIDYANIMPDPRHSGLTYFYIEQGGNYTENSMASADYSARFFKQNLQHLF